MPHPDPHRTPVSLLIVAIAIVTAALGLAACGGDDDDDGGSTSTTSTTTSASGAGGGSETVSLKATDFKFTPDDPSVKSGQVTFDVANDGQAIHNLEVEGPNGDQELPSDLAVGESGQLTVDLDKPGTYTFYCPVGNHRELGMVGKVKVQ